MTFLLAMGSWAWAADGEPIRFTGQVVRVAVLGGEPAVPVDVDPRFGVEVRIEAADAPFAAGETRVFAVHSPTRLFVGDPQVGGRYAFDLTRVSAGPPPRYAALHARFVGSAEVPAANPRISVSAGELAAAIGAPDTACAADADCGVAFVHLTGAYTCCLGCGTSTAAAPTWLDHLAATCADADQFRVSPAGPGDLAPCPSLACPQGLAHAACVQGRCELR